MIFAHTADLHFDGQDAHESLDEQIERLIAIGDHARQLGARLMLCAGDVFERTSTPAERNAAIEVFAAWAYRFPVVVVYGNHDRPGDLDYLGRLKTEHAISVVDRPLVVCPFKKVDELSVACLPWPRKAWLAGKLKAGQDVNQVATEAMRVILDGFAAKWRGSTGLKLLLGHVEIGKAIMDSGQPMTGLADIELSVEELVNTGADYCALGHIHQRQSWGMEGTEICYAGSPRQTTFGQEVGKGYALIDFSDPASPPPIVNLVDAPGRELHTITARWDGECLNSDTWDEECLKGHAVRLTYHVDAANSGQAAAEAATAKERLLKLGVHSVKLDPRVANVHRVRSELIREAKTHSDRVRAYWGALGEEPARAEPILEKLNELETAGG